jgi:prevent-host-death family protein
MFSYAKVGSWSLAIKKYVDRLSTFRNLPEDFVSQTPLISVGVSNEVHLTNCLLWMFRPRNPTNAKEILILACVWFMITIITIMKSSRKTGASNMISTHQMRFEFDRVLKAVKAGRSLTLTYRNKPLARIVPLDEQTSIPEDDPIFRLHELAEPVGPLTNVEIDQLVYGQ